MTPTPPEKNPGGRESDAVFLRCVPRLYLKIYKRALVLTMKLSNTGTEHAY